MKTEEDRTAAVLKGNFLAKWFPDVWRKQEVIEIGHNDSITELQKLLKQRLRMKDSE